MAESRATAMKIRTNVRRRRVMPFLRRLAVVSAITMFGQTQSAGALSPPTEPTNVEATDGDYTHMIRVTWDAATGATAYRIWRSTSYWGYKQYWGETTSTTHDHTAMDQDTTYFFWIQACNPSGCNSGFINAYDDGFASWPGRPQNVTASDGAFADHVAIDWDGVPNTHVYWVFRGSTPAGHDTALADNLTGSLFFDTTARQGEQYYYFVRSCTMDECGDLSLADAGHRLSPPASLDASDGTYHWKVDLEWSASEGATYYQLHRGTSSQGYSTTWNLTHTVYADQESLPGTLYWYWIRSCNPSGCTSPVGQTTGFRALSKPTDIQASDGNHTFWVAVSWPSVTGADWYELQRQTLGTPGYATIADDIIELNFDDTSAFYEHYLYRVRGCTTTGCGSWSDPDIGYRAGPPPPPQNVRATDGDFEDRVRITWDPVDDALAYQIYRSLIDDPSTSDTLHLSVLNTEFEDHTGFSGIVYFYWIGASNGSGFGPYSESDTGFRSSHLFEDGFESGTTSAWTQMIR